MAQVALTDLSVKSLKTDKQQELFWDTILPAFGVRVSPSSKAFVVRTGKPRRMTTIGKYPEMSLKAARIAAISYLTEESSPTSKTYQEAKIGFLRDARRRLKRDTARQYEQYLDVLVFRGQVSSITRTDINEQLAQYDGKPFAQNYAFATLKSFLNWCIDNEIIDRSPLRRVKVPNKVPSRSRVLTDQELGRVWNSLEDNVYGRMVRVMLLSGQRRMEVRNLKPEDVADGLITFHTKGDKQNIIPVTPLVEEQLKHLPFTFNNWSYNLNLLKAEARVEFTHHDLRRSMATKMASVLKINDITIERILGHAVNPVKHTYNRYSYIEEARDALLQYEAHVLKVAGA